MRLAAHSPYEHHPFLSVHYIEILFKRLIAQNGSLLDFTVAPADGPSPFITLHAQARFSDSQR